MLNWMESIEGPICIDLYYPFSVLMTENVFWVKKSQRGWHEKEEKNQGKQRLGISEFFEINKSYQYEWLNNAQQS